MTHRFWRGIHLGLSHDSDVDRLVGELPALADMGLNVLMVEVNYGFAYESHPELRGPDPITRAGAARLVAACQSRDVRLIPQFQCLGHQSWAKTTFPLLKVHPEFDETPGQFPDNEGIYCRSWCPQHPGVNPIIFALFDELLEAFEPTALRGWTKSSLSAQNTARGARARPAALFARPSTTTTVTSWANATSRC